MSGPQAVLAEQAAYTRGEAERFRPWIDVKNAPHRWIAAGLR